MQMEPKIQNIPSSSKTLPRPIPFRKRVWGVYIFILDAYNPKTYIWRTQKGKKKQGGAIMFYLKDLIDDVEMNFASKRAVLSYRSPSGPATWTGSRNGP